MLKRKMINLDQSLYLDFLEKFLEITLKKVNRMGAKKGT